MGATAVITGIGLATPLGDSPDEVLRRLESGESAAVAPAFDASAFDCRLCAPIRGFRPEAHFQDCKTLRLMNRDAQLAVVAARRAMDDAGVRSDQTCSGDAIALFGATGLTGMPPEEIGSLVEHSADQAGRLDLLRFGRVTLKRVRPVLSFKILANMPICFVSIFANIRGENAVYTPWEGQAAQAIESAVRAIEAGRVPCAVTGGCDVRVHEFAFVSLQQLGAFESWRRGGLGSVPGEGAAFLVLEEEQAARARGARVYARIRAAATTVGEVEDDAGAAGRELAAATVAEGLDLASPLNAIVAADDGDPAIRQAEEAMLAALGAGRASGDDAGSPARSATKGMQVIRPKSQVGNLYAAAAAVQVGLAAAVARKLGTGSRVLANCIARLCGSAAFILEGL